MANWDLGELARAAGADIRGGELPVSVEAVGTDSRSLPSACLFVALRGERFDGHDFVPNAVAAGARAILIDARGDDQLPVLGVPRLIADDTLIALGAVATHARHQHAKPVVAVTGSNGKTTTKELCAAALGVGGEVHKTAGNLNNLIGVPLTLLAWPDAAWAGVVEMGMNAPGEIARLTEIASPDVGLITNANRVHLEGLGSVAAVGRAKGELYANLAADAVAVVNIDDPVIAAEALPLAGTRRRITFGWAAEAHVRVVSAVSVADGLSVRFAIDGRNYDATLPLFGPHNAYNAAAALAAGIALGFDSADRVGAMCARLAEVELPAGRLDLIRDLAINGTTTISVIDDTYNANPDSMAAAFAAQTALAGDARRIAVLGDMFELGADAAALHRDVGAAAASAGVELLFALGALGGELAAGAQAGGADAHAFDDISSLLAALDGSLRDGDWLLVKGSRGMRMERVVAHLKALAASAAGSAPRD